jgi:hypothetical protein
LGLLVVVWSTGRASAQDESTEATKALWAAISAFDDVEVPRTTLLAHCKDVAKRFPDHEYGKRAKAMAVILEKMVAEDEEFARKAAQAKPGAVLPLEQHIANLIFHLRDQHGRQWSSPGSCDIFGGPGYYFDEHAAKGTTPAHQLVAVGYDAVPQLIAALDDDRFCRSVECGRFHFFSHYVLRIGDCAGAILERIAGVSFGAGSNHQYGSVVKVKKEVAAWWQEFQKKGEKQQLSDATMAGTVSYHQLERLVRKYPDAAFEAIAKGLPATKIDWMRSNLIITLCALDAKRAVPVLREELRGPFLLTRVQAARQLLRQGDETGLAALLEEWAKFDPGAEQDPFGRDGFEQLIDVLARSGRKKAVDAVAKQWKRFSVWNRHTIVTALGNVEKDLNGKALAGEVVEAIGNVLFAALKDREELLGLLTGRNNREQQDPRICDYAAEALAKLCNQPDLFDFFGTLTQRNRQLYEVKNAWLVLHGKPIVAVPAAPRVSPLPASKMGPLVKAMLAQQNASGRAASTAAIEKLGLPALAEVRKALRDCDDRHPTYANLAALATRLACVVQEVVVVEFSVPLTKEVQARLDALVGKSLTAAALHDLLAGVYGAGHKTYGGIRLLVHRDEPEGLRIEVFLLEPAPLPQGKGQVVLYPFRVIVEGDSEFSLGASAATFAVGNPFPALSETDFRELQHALTAAPEKSFRIHIGWYIAP